MTGPEHVLPQRVVKVSGSPRVSIPSNASPPNSTVGTAMSKMAAKIREASDIA
jgi:hypothetical protein